jgi:hypothetical protein
MYRTSIAGFLAVCTALTVASFSLNCGSDSSLNCGSDDPAGTTEYGEVQIVVGAGAWEDLQSLAAGGGPVPQDEIESFLLRVDRIILNVAAEDDSAEAEADSTGKIVIFDASQEPTADNEIDLADLTNLSDIMSSAQVPPGGYQQIRLEIADPRLNLVGDTAGEYRTNVSLTANGRLFANVDLVISPGDTIYLHLVLDRIHLVEKGNGDFVLTPKLEVEILPELPVY